MKVFIAGPRAVLNLNDSVKERLLNIYNNNYTVLVGDANGVDRLIQSFYSDLKYENVIIFASGDKVRNNLGNWTVEKISVYSKIKGFDFYAQKDVAMAKSADYGFMIWNGKSKGTLNNMMNLISYKKNVLVYFMPLDRFLYIDTDDKLKKLIDLCPADTKTLVNKLNKKQSSKYMQISFQ
ncbi:hypothetical protein SAMN02745751_03572 [Dethiosulfatibacter aminovorans DSM 17477]|uniref:Uncharacterized protein n=1 Tax=Dethiosulfatibacter aminovorans DSM 17477 TaxID=1121476 RepID=A0A1M6MS83_9FIRM|nr:hypothetical protein [Dethiosulfatibacter aminovorans]SHJ86385.1 hypothetical protein SAMN02745751_03572 [Dethiosulfatibacter aminovorans DSM 17477]